MTALVSRWTLTTLDGMSSYTFPINPNAQGSPHAKESIQWLWTVDGYAGVRARPQPVAWSFSGVLRDQQQYDDLVSWVTTHRTRLKLVTDLPETLIVRLNGFAPERTAPQRRNVPWRHTYSIKALVFDYQPGGPVSIQGPLASILTVPKSGSLGPVSVPGALASVGVTSLDGDVSTP